MSSKTKLIKISKKYLGQILILSSTILMFTHRSVYWLSLAIIGFFYTIYMDSREEHEETSMYISDLISMRSSEFKESMLNSSGETSIYYVEAPYKEVSPPRLELFESYWLERLKGSEMRLKIRFEDHFESAKKNLDRDKLERCLPKLRDEVRHYHVALGIFSDLFIEFKNDMKLKNWFLEVVKTYNEFVKKLEGDSRALKIKFSIEVDLNLSSFSAED